MSAIISDKFRIFNAHQFLESITEGSSDTDSNRSRMYFFVGRSERWDSVLEIYNKNATSFQKDDQVFIGTDLATATFKATVRSVSQNSLFLYEIGPNPYSTPQPGSLLKSASSAATALTGTYRYSTEDIPPAPIDNQKEKYSIYREIIGAKRINTENTRTVIKRYSWETTTKQFSMWKPDYSETASSGLVGKNTTFGESSLADSKFYVLNSKFEVFKCLYNGQKPDFPTGQLAIDEPTTTPQPGKGSYVNGIFKEEPGNAGYIWKYMFTIPTNDVLKFLATDFFPIVLPNDITRVSVANAAVDGSVEVALIKSYGESLPNGTFYAPIIGDGDGGVVKIVNTSSTINSVEVVSPGQGYTYASIPLANGTGAGESAYGLFTNQALTSPYTQLGSSAKGELEPIISPQGGHGSNPEHELYGKRVMISIRLTYAEGGGDFPISNDFRRIGIIKDPYIFGTSNFATTETLSGTKALKINNAGTPYLSDEIIKQEHDDGTITYGTVVAWIPDAGNSQNGILKYYQSSENHLNNGKIREFVSGTGVAVQGLESLASGQIDVAQDGSLSGIVFADGLANQEIHPNSGDIIYVENRRLISRAPDQIEDIKLVIEF